MYHNSQLSWLILQVEGQVISLTNLAVFSRIILKMRLFVDPVNRISHILVRFQITSVNCEGFEIYKFVSRYLFCEKYGNTNWYEIITRIWNMLRWGKNYIDDWTRNRKPAFLTGCIAYLCSFNFLPEGVKTKAKKVSSVKMVCKNRATKRGREWGELLR